MTIYEPIRNALENIDPLVVLGGLSLLFGLRQGYKTITSFDSSEGATPPAVAGGPPGYDPNLAFRKQKWKWYPSLVASLIGIFFGIPALYEGIKESYLS